MNIVRTRRRVAALACIPVSARLAKSFVSRHPVAAIGSGCGSRIRGLAVHKLSGACAVAAV